MTPTRAMALIWLCGFSYGALSFCREQPMPRERVAGNCLIALVVAGVLWLA